VTIEFIAAVGSLLIWRWVSIDGRIHAEPSKSLFTIFEVLEVIKVAICTWEAEAIAMGDEAEKAVSQRREPGAV
jgi:hypothetical protein